MTMIKKLREPKAKKACTESFGRGNTSLFNLLKIKTDIKAGNICIEQCEARAPGEQYAANCVSACQATGLA